MKVLVINWRDITNPEAGGAEIHIHEILKRKPENWQVDFYSATYPGCEEMTVLPEYTIHRIPNNSLFNFTFKKYYKKHLAGKNYDLIIDDVSKIPLAVPRYIKDRPVLAVHHHVHGKSLFSQLMWPMAFYVYHMERFLLRYYRDIPLISVSESSETDLRDLYDYKYLEVSHNGIDFQDLNRDRKVKKRDDSLIYLGRLKKYKRVDHLIQAVHILKDALPSIHLHIAGKGDDEPRLKALVEELDLVNNVTFHGFVPDEDKAALLQSCRIFTIASEKEGWGISVLEANAAGLPSVAYGVQGLKDSIRDKETGILVNNGDTGALASAILGLIKDKKIFQTYARQAVEYARTFSWEKTALDFYSIAQAVVKNFGKNQ